MAAPSITQISPVDGYNQFPVGGSVTILFDSEVDAYTAKRAIFLYGPDFDVFVGPGMDSRVAFNNWICPIR